MLSPQSGFIVNKLGSRASNGHLLLSAAATASFPLTRYYREAQLRSTFTEADAFLGVSCSAPAVPGHAFG
jgi:hypothetical protein